MATIDRLADRDAFRRLRLEGRRYRAGPLSVVVHSGPDRSRPALAFAIPKRVGNAVTRNRLRRQLREVFRHLERDGRLTPAEYLVLVGPGAAGAAYPDLRGWVERLVEQIDQRR